MSKLACTALAMMCLSCSGAPASDPEPEQASSGGERAAPAADDGLEVSGTLGAIGQDQVNAALNPRVPRFQRCLVQRSSDVEYLAGDIRLTFRIHTDGTVAWVYLSQSSLGDRQTEQCVLTAARAMHFPPPRGGEAEFTWGVGFDPPDDVRPPVSWDADRLGARQRSRLGGVARECNAQGNFEVTAYVEPGGRVLSAGGSVPSAEAESVLDCILERVRGLSMPDPGSYAAKVTFPIQ